MSPIDSGPTNDERIVYQTNCHWAMYLGPAFVLIIGGLALKSQGIHAAALMAFGLVWGVFAYLSLHKSRLVLTEKSLLIDAGFPVVKSDRIPLERIMTVDYYQPSLGSILNFGKIMLVYDGRSRRVIRFVSSPAELVTYVRHQIVALNPPPQEP